MAKIEFTPRELASARTEFAAETAAGVPVQDQTLQEPKKSTKIEFTPDEIEAFKISQKSPYKKTLADTIRLDEIENKRPFIKPILDLPIDAANAATTGFRRASGGLNQLIFPAIDKIAGTKLYEREKAYQQGEDAKFNARYGNSGNVQGLALGFEGLPSMIGGAVTLLPKIGMKGLSKLPQIAKLAGLGGAQGAISYDESGEKPIPEKALLGAGIGAGVGVAGGALKLGGKALEKLAPRNWGNISLPEMKKAILEHKGLETPLGEIINSPSLKKAQENIIEAIPLSGLGSSRIRTGNKLIKEGEDLINTIKPKKTTENFGQTVQDILREQEKSKLMSVIGEGEDILSNLKPKNAPENFGQQVVNHLKQSKMEIGKQKTQNYREANEIADKSGTKVILTKFNNALDSERQKIANSFIPDSEKSALTKVIDSLSSSRKENLSQALGASSKGETFGNTYLKKGALNAAYEQAFKNNDIFQLGVLNRARNSLKEDVADAVAGGAPKEVKDAFNKAEEFYKTKYAPYKDPDVLKFTNRKGDSDKIESHFLRTGKDDEVNRLSKLTDLLPEEMNKTMAYRYLSKAYEDRKLGKNILNPESLLKSYNSLGEKTKRKLIPDESIHNAMGKYSARVEKDIINTDKDILKAISPDTKADDIESLFLKGGKNDNAQLLNKLISRLPEEMKGELAYRYMSKAYRDPKFGKDELDPIALSKLYYSLGEKTRKTLFGDTNFDKAMSKLASRLEKNQKALSAMYNPETGASLKSNLGLFGSVSLGGLPSAGANLAQRFLTSRSGRHLILNSLKNKANKGLGGMATPD